MSTAARVMVALVLCLSSVAAWTLTYDDTSLPGTGVFGAYRDRWFLVDLALTYLALWSVRGAIRPLSRKGVFRLVAGHLAFVLVVCGMELVALLGVVDFDHLISPSDRAAAPADPRLRRSTAANLTLEGMAVPDLQRILGMDADPVPVRFRTDSRGYRNPREKTDPRVVCLGDSILVGAMVPVEELLTERLERILDVDVLNAADVAFSPQEEQIRLERAGVAVKGRLVLQFIFEGNDLSDSIRWREWLEFGFSNRWPKSGLLKAVLFRLHGPRRGAGLARVATFRGADGAQVEVGFFYDSDRIDAEMGEWPAMSTEVAAGAERFRAQGAEFAVVFVPAKCSVVGPLVQLGPGTALEGRLRPTTAFREAVASWCAAEGFPFHDCSPALTALARKGVLPFHRADTHLSSAGHEAIAVSLAPWVRAQIEE